MAVVNRALWALIRCGQGRDAGMGTHNTQTDTPTLLLALCGRRNRNRNNCFRVGNTTRHCCITKRQRLSFPLSVFQWSVTCVTDGYAHPLSLSLEMGSIGVQGSAKRLRPGLVDMRRKNCVLLPAAGRKRNFSSSYSPNLAGAF